MKRIALIVLAAGLLAACSFKGDVEFNYKHPERYQVGDATVEQRVDKIDIDWYHGIVDIRPTDKPVIRIHEASDSVLTDSIRMRHYVNEEGTLNIQFCDSGKRFGHDYLKGLNKRLIIEVPRDITLDGIEIESVNGRVKIDSVRSRELTIEGVSIVFTGVYPTLPDEMDVEGVNSQVTLFVPPTVGTTVKMEGVNTDFSSELPVVRSDGKTVIGDGGCQINIEGVNCDLNIKEIKQ